MRTVYETCKALMDYFKYFALTMNEILFYKVPFFDITIMTIMFGTGFIIYVAFVLAKFVKSIII